MPREFYFTVADDVSACVASQLFNTLPSLLRGSDSEMYKRLQEIILNAIIAYTEASDGWGLPPEPSIN